MKKNILITALAMVPIMASANMYKKDLQVFTLNTAEKRCETPLRLIYKGDKARYAKEIAKDKDEMTRAVFGGASMALNNGLAGGVVGGLAVFAVQGLVDAATGDHEYLYVTECNSGANKTRLMSLVVSNTAMSESAWTSLAKQDQVRSAK